MINYRAIAQTAIGQYSAAQDKEELAVLLSLLDTAKVGRAIEIGTFAGGLTWALTQLPSVYQVITIDIAIRPRPLLDRVIFITGDSGDDATVLSVDRMLDDNLADLLVIDGGHDSKQVRRDWELYRDFVRHGGIVVFHDINEWNHHPEIQVRKEWLKISGHYPRVEICADRGNAPGTGVLWMTGG